VDDQAHVGLDLHAEQLERLHTEVADVEGVLGLDHQPPALHAGLGLLDELLGDPVERERARELEAVRPALGAAHLITNGRVLLGVDLLAEGDVLQLLARAQLLDVSFDPAGCSARVDAPARYVHIGLAAEISDLTVDGMHA
jgi:hypothetical protein